MKELEGIEVVKYLNGHDSVRDGSLINLTVQHINTTPVIELTFEVARAEGVRIVNWSFGVSWNSTLAISKRTLRTLFRL